MTGDVQLTGSFKTALILLLLLLSGKEKSCSSFCYLFNLIKIQVAIDVC